MKIQKVLASVAALALIGCMAVVPTFAASTMNANEQAVFDKCFESGVVFDENLQGTVTNYFIRNDVDMTATQKDQIIGYMDAAFAVKETPEYKALEAEGGIINLSQLPYSQKEILLTNLQNAGNVMGLTVDYNAADNTLTITDGEGAIVAETAATVKKTGETSSLAIVIAAASLVALLGAAAVVAGKKTEA